MLSKGCIKIWDDGVGCKCDWVIPMMGEGQTGDTLGET